MTKKFEIVNNHNYYILFYNDNIVSFSFIVRIVYGSLVPNRNVQCKKLLKKFNINTVFSITSNNKEDLEHFSNFIESRCNDGKIWNWKD